MCGSTLGWSSWVVIYTQKTHHFWGAIANSDGYKFIFNWPLFWYGNRTLQWNIPYKWRCLASKITDFDGQTIPARRVMGFYLSAFLWFCFNGLVEGKILTGNQLDFPMKIMGFSCNFSRKTPINWLSGMMRRSWLASWLASWVRCAVILCLLAGQERSPSTWNRRKLG